MNLHEYQAKAILARYGLKIPKGKVASTPEEAETAAREIGPGPWMLKAQVHAGGRGKAGGIRTARDPADVRRMAEEMIGMRLVTPQSGAQGNPVSRVLVEEDLPSERELYLGVTIDRARERVAVIGSSVGGMEIEEVSEHSPEKIHTLLIDPGCGLTNFQGRRLAMDLGFQGGNIGVGAAVASSLYRAFIENDCSLLEVNPLVQCRDGALVVLDAKMNIDDNALYRHPEISALRDVEQEDPLDVEASKLGLHFINLTGNIGCIVNGAGLAMATLDILHYYKGEPANFLDVGGGVSSEVVCNAFQLLTSDPKIKGILINIFGGIARCDDYARGIVEAIREKPLTVPLVVRLEGTHVEEGRKILHESGFNIIYAATLREAAQKIVEQVKEKT